MKYSEAVDMILYGGRCRVVSPKSPWFVFSEGGHLVSYHDGFALSITKEEFKGDWIVEKDGVVYEEYPIGKMRIIEQRVPIDIIKKYFFIKDRTGTQDEPAELEEGGEPWEGIKMPIIADEVNEDWLEKKMSCFLGRHIRTNPIDNLAMHYCEQEDCGISKCPFCFPEEKPTDELANSWELCPENKGADFEMQEVKHEKVTIHYLWVMIERILETESLHFDLRHRSPVDIDRIKEVEEKQSAYRRELNKKFEYLVSLREK